MGSLRLDYLTGEYMMHTGLTLANVCGDRLAVDADLIWQNGRVEEQKKVGKHFPKGPNDHILIPKLSDKS